MADPKHGDERGIEYAKDMIGEKVPPVIVSGDLWIDGRHRVWAAKKENKKTLQAIDLGEWNIKPVVPNLGKLLK